MSEPWRDEKTGKIFCPVNDCDCPYYEEHGVCTLENVQNECNDFYTMWAKEIEAEKKMIKVYKNDAGNYVCELWRTSTKHPDSVFHMEDFKTVDFIDKEYQVFQWLLECASKLTFPFHAKELAEYAFENWVNFI